MLRPAESSGTILLVHERNRLFTFMCDLQPGVFIDNGAYL